MENKEKIERLEIEIKELEAKKQEKDVVRELFNKRNRLKFAKLYTTGGFLKNLGKGLTDWADKKNEELDKVKKEDAEIILLTWRLSGR